LSPYHSQPIVPEPPIASSQPGQRSHPQSAYIKALLLKVEEDFATCTRLRRFLMEHPLLALELGFRPFLDISQPYGFDVQRTVPTDRWLREKQRTRQQPVLQALLVETIQVLREEIPGLGEFVALDVTHRYAWVKKPTGAPTPQNASTQISNPKAIPNPEAPLRYLIQNNLTLPDLCGPENKHRHILWHPACGLPGRLLRPGSILKHTDGNELTLADLYTVIRYESWHLLDDGHKLLLDPLYHLIS